MPEGIQPYFHYRSLWALFLHNIIKVPDLVKPKIAVSPNSAIISTWSEPEFLRKGRSHDNKVQWLWNRKKFIASPNCPSGYAIPKLLNQNLPKISQSGTKLSQ